MLSLVLHIITRICCKSIMITFLFSIYIPPSESMVHVTLGLQICNAQNEFAYSIQGN